MSEVIPFRERGGREHSVESSLANLVTKHADLFRRILVKNPDLEFAPIPDAIKNKPEAELVRIIQNPPSEESLQGEDAEKWVAAYRIFETQAEETLLSGQDVTKNTTPPFAVEK